MMINSQIPPRSRLEFTPTEDMRSELFLSENASICCCEGYLVFLDIARERYLALPPRDAECLMSLSGFNSCEARTVVELLEREGLVVRNSTRGRPFRWSSIVGPSQALIGTEGAPPSLCKADLLQYMAAWIRASIMLRARSLKSIVEFVRSRKDRSGNYSGELDEAITCARRFFIMQPLLPSSGSTDIRKSLTLLEYLALNNLYATWVFGVRLSPFGAATWVQHGDTVLSGTLGSVYGYTPLLVI
jgi:hypothetical protein